VIDGHDRNAVQQKRMIKHSIETNSTKPGPRQILIANALRGRHDLGQRWLPLERFSIAMTSAFLLARSAFGLACFFALLRVFKGFTFFAALRLIFAGSGVGVAPLFSTESLVIGFSWTGLRSSHPSLRSGEIARRIFD
jgi:hypothetical protein